MFSVEFLVVGVIFLLLQPLLYFKFVHVDPYNYYYRKYGMDLISNGHFMRNLMTYEILPALILIFMIGNMIIVDYDHVTNYVICYMVMLLLKLMLAVKHITSNIKLNGSVHYHVFIYGVNTKRPPSIAQNKVPYIHSDEFVSVSMKILKSVITYISMMIMFMIVTGVLNEGLLQ